MANKSAKDLAFDRERCKYKKQISELQGIIRDRDHLIESCQGQIYSMSSKIEVQKEWIDRLLEYTEMSKDDLKALIDREKRMHDTAIRLAELSIFGRGYLK